MPNLADTNPPITTLSTDIMVAYITVDTGSSEINGTIKYIGMNMLDILDTKEVIRRLKLLKGKYPTISKDTGLPYNWISKLAYVGVTGNGNAPSSYRIDILRDHPLIKDFQYCKKNRKKV